MQSNITSSKSILALVLCKYVRIQLPFSGMFTLCVWNSIFYGAFYDSFMEIMVKHMHPQLYANLLLRMVKCGLSIAMAFPPLRNKFEQASVCAVCVGYVCESEHTIQRQLNCVVSILMRCLVKLPLCWLIWNSSI